MSKDTDELFSELNQAKSEKDVKNFYERNAENLEYPDAATYLEKLFEERKLKKADVIRATGLDRTFAYHLLSGHKTFTRDKLLIFAVAARLSVEDTNASEICRGSPALCPGLPGRCHHLHAEPETFH